MNRLSKFIILTSLTTAVNAQSSGVSPYSLFGLGQTQVAGYAYGEILGGTQIGNNSSLYVNSCQPASYSQVKYTTLDLGGNYQGIYQSSAQGSLWNTTGGFRSMGIAIPLVKGLGTSVGIKPLTLVGYDMLNEGFDTTFGGFTQSFKGSGGINKAHIGFGLKPIPFFSFGFNANYLFGSSDMNSRIIFDNNQLLNSVMNKQRLLVNGWSWDGGAMFHVPIKMNRLNIGFSYSNIQNILASHDNSSFTYVPNSSGSETPLDTIISEFQPKGYITLPFTFGVGLQYEKIIKDLPIPAWSISIQYKVVGQEELRDFWSAGNKPYSGPYDENSKYVSFSGSVIPALAFPERRFKSIASQIAYRASFRSGSNGLFINPEELVSSWQSTLGLGIPLGGSTMLPGDVKFATMHLGFQIGNLGTSNPKTLNEFSTRLIVGVTLNDQWFLKFKYR